jgi:hypothetical protein
MPQVERSIRELRLTVRGGEASEKEEEEDAGVNAGRQW